MESTIEQTQCGIELVKVLALVLERLIHSNLNITLSNPEQITKFHALKTPSITILQYLERIHKYASCSTECFILSLIYIDRIIQRNKFVLTELNVHRVVITAVLVAAKFFDDAYYNNAYYAKVGGVHVSELNGLEVEFLFRISFSLHVASEIFIKYHSELLSHAVVSGGQHVTASNEVISLQTIPTTQISVVSSISTREKTAVVETYAYSLPNEEAHKPLHHICHDSNHKSMKTQQITPSPSSSGNNNSLITPNYLCDSETKDNLKSLSSESDLSYMNTQTNSAPVGESNFPSRFLQQRHHSLPLKTKILLKGKINTLIRNQSSFVKPYCLDSLIPIGNKLRIGS